MEYRNQPLPDNREVEPVELPLVLRYHHLLHFAMFADHINRDHRYPRGGEIKPAFDQLYLNPEIAEEYLLKRAESIAQGLHQDFRGQKLKDDDSSIEERQKMAIEYAGPKGEFLQEHVEGIADVERQFIMSTPERKVKFTWDTDAICNTCQGNGSNKPADHCFAKIPEDESNDVLFYRIIEKTRTEPELVEDMEVLKDEVGRHVFELPLGTLRSESVMSFIYKEVMDHYKKLRQTQS